MINIYILYIKLTKPNRWFWNITNSKKGPTQGVCEAVLLLSSYGSDQDSFCAKLLKGHTTRQHLNIILGFLYIARPVLIWSSLNFRHSACDTFSGLNVLRLEVGVRG